MAREVAAITGSKLRDPVKLDLLPHGPAPRSRSQIEDFDLCPRYSALVFENVTVQPSPLWLQARLTAIGLNPINNIVDLTNYVMAELAQPMHAFDRRPAAGDTIFVRARATPGERFVALNDEEYTLDPSNLVIADAGGAIAPGRRDRRRGQRHQRHDHAVVLESANFQASSVRKTSSAHQAAHRRLHALRKGAGPGQHRARPGPRHRTAAASFRPASAWWAAWPISSANRRRPPPIELPLDWLARKLGRAIAAAEVRDILERLEFGVTEPEPRRVLASPCPPGAPPRTSPSRTIWWKKWAA